MRRDDFPKKTIETLAKRAAYICSNPACKALTVGPHSEDTKSLSIGHAAHIHAAAIGGPRFDSTQTSTQRKSISNGIWICRNCGDLIDKDEQAYPAQVLKRWKHDHEAMISEVRDIGYEQSLVILKSKQSEPQVAKKVISMLEDRRVLWASFDAEFPDRVRISLDTLRTYLTQIRGDLPGDSPLDKVLLSLTKTIHVFFNSLEDVNLDSLQCDCNAPDWCRFRDCLLTLRKSIGIQIQYLADAYHLVLSSDLRSIAPTFPDNL